MRGDRVQAVAAAVVGGQILHRVTAIGQSAPTPGNTSQLPIFARPDQSICESCDDRISYAGSPIDQHISGFVWLWKR